SDHFGAFRTGLGVMNSARRDLVRLACLEFLRSLSVDQQGHLAFEHITGLWPWMGVPADIYVWHDFGDADDGLVVGARHVELLQWCALDQRVLGERRRGTGEHGHEGNRCNCFEHWSSLEEGIIGR